MEKIVENWLINFLNKNNYFSKNQFGFRSGRNTTDVLLYFMTHVYKGLNDGRFCAGLFVDTMKAIDTVDHAVLLNRWHDAGVRGTVYNWFKLYLTNRLQQTRVEYELNHRTYMSYGSLRGSVLSGPLFLTRINSLCNGNFNGNLVSFADDTALYYNAHNILKLRNQI